MRCDPSGTDANPVIPVTLDLPEGIPPLRAFYLYLTTGCNLFCRHCWITPKFVRGKPDPGAFLSLEALKFAVAEAKPLGLRAAKLTGGEPFLHPRFLELVDFLTDEGLSMDIESNGTLIDAPTAVHLRQKTNVHFISISLDSVNPEYHDQFRGVKGAFTAAVSGIKHLVNAGYRPQIIMSPHRGNVAEIESIIQLALDLGAGSVKFNPVTSGGRGKIMHEQGEGLSHSEILDIVHYIRGPLQEKTPIPLYIMVPPAFLTVKELLNASHVGSACQVRHILGILGDGKMALCGIGRNIPELCFGTLGSDSLREVWISHPALLQLRDDLSGEFPGICGDCIHAQRCLTYCVAMNYLESGKLVFPSSLCFQAEQNGTFPATRRRSFERESMH